MEIINDGQWINGLDSISYTLAQGSYAWGQNVVNRGGIVETRQGFAEVAAIQQRDPRGMAAVTIGGITYIIAAIGRFIYKLNVNNPEAGLVKINGLECRVGNDPDDELNPIPTTQRMVHFEVCVQSQEFVGEITKQITPKLVVIIQDGGHSAQFWDPSAPANKQAGTIDSKYPETADKVVDGKHKNLNTPTGTFMKWIGDRLWVSQGKKIMASNLLNPFQFTETDVTASGGYFLLPDNATGMGVTHDFKALLAFTHFTTTAFQAGIENRVQWPDVQDFQRVIFPSIGCASHRTVINMYGMTWWMSHDGIMGLDNALAAYQTTRLDIKDLNMIRSKQGVSWAQGGGSAGSFGNFLFFSVPSASHWNQHTWVMDQAPISLLAGTSAPSWCANWTGIRPEQWVTTIVGGQQRCFCISRDLTSEGHQSTVWEAFIGQRMDVPKVGADRKARDIGCAFESRFIGLSPSQFAKLRWIELDVAEVVGNVSLRVYYCGRRTSYKQILNTHLTSSVSNTTEEIFNPDDPIPVNVPQYRTIRSVTDAHSTTDSNPNVQTPYLRNKDREFSVLVQWNGQMAVSGLRIAVDPEPDYMEGTDFQDEYLRRSITAEGTGVIGCALPDPNAPNGQLISKFLSPAKPRWVEFPSYDSAVPNGVFFVAELFASPPPDDYPSNVFPITVNLTTETEGADIYWTKNGPNPHGPPNKVGTHYDGTHRPVIHVGDRLKARGERAHMSPSVLFNRVYEQSKVADVVFQPPPGGYPPDVFVPHLEPLDVGLAVAYNFDALVNGALKDFSLNGANGAPYNTTIVDGKHGKAFSFNGTTSWIQLLSPAALQLTGSSTWMAWVKATANPAGDGYIISKADGTSGWGLKTGNITGQHRFYMAVSSHLINRQSNTIRELNTWYHVAGVYNAETHDIHIVINGVLDDGTLNGTVPTSQINSAANANIGRRSGAIGYFQGLIDDVRVYNRALSLPEIQSLMNKPVDPTAPAQGDFAVTMTSATPGAEIHWAYHPNPPGPPITQADTLYDPAHPPHPQAGQTFQAKAFKQYYVTSNQTSGRYFAKPRCATPTCTPDEGAYQSGEYPKSIHIASATAGSKLRATINNVNVEDGEIRANPSNISVEPTDILRVIAQKEGSSDSFTKQATYTVAPAKVATPVFEHPIVIRHGDHHEADVHIVCSTPDVNMRWTIETHDVINHPTRTNGNLIESNDSTFHIGPAQPGHIGHKTIRVIAFRLDMTDSDEATATYDWEG